MDNSHDIEFIGTFNEYYPFERLIIENPQGITVLFDDVKLSEVFIPKVEGKFYNNDYRSIYVTLLCKGVEFRMSYFDFDDSVRETIRCIVKESFGDLAWEQMYVEYDNKPELGRSLGRQFHMITKKYGKCEVKDGFQIDSTLKLLGVGKNFFVRRPDFKVEDIRNCVGANIDRIREKHDMYYTRGEAEYEASMYERPMMSIEMFNELGLAEEYGYNN